METMYNLDEAVNYKRGNSGQIARGRVIRIVLTIDSDALYTLHDSELHTEDGNILVSEKALNSVNRMKASV